MDFTKVAVGFDGGAEANDALALARDMAEPDATLILAEVFDPGLLAGRPSVYATEVRARTDELSHRAERVLGGRPFEPVVAAGTAARQLNRLAHETGADLIVVGSTHRGPIGRVLAGTVADRLLNGAPCAVAVAPRGYAKREGSGSAGPVVVGYNGTEESDMALEAGRRMAVALGATLRLLCGMLHAGVEAWPRPLPARGAELASQAARPRRGRMPGGDGCRDGAHRG